MANEETLCCSCGQRVPKAIVDAVLAQRRNTVAADDSARRAAEAVTRLREFLNEDYILIARHFKDTSKDRDITGDIEDLITLRR